MGILPVPPFLGRYGGDEFILVAYAGTEDEIVALAAEIRRLLEMFCRENATPYLLSLGLGWAELTGGDDTFLDCLKRADKRLYLDKARMKRSASDQSA